MDYRIPKPSVAEEVTLTGKKDSVILGKSVKRGYDPGSPPREDREMGRTIYTVSTICAVCMLTGCATTVKVTSNPTHSVVVASEDMNGNYKPWRTDAQKYTPAKKTLGFGKHLWVNVEREGYMSRDPEYVRAERWLWGRWPWGRINLHFDLNPTLREEDRQVIDNTGAEFRNGEYIFPGGRVMIPYRGRLVDPVKEGFIKNERGQWVLPTR